MLKGRGRPSHSLEEERGSLHHSFKVVIIRDQMVYCSWKGGGVPLPLKIVWRHKENWSLPSIKMGRLKGGFNGWVWKWKDSAWKKGRSEQRTFKIHL